MTDGPTLDVGRLALLRAVALHGSIAAAARALSLTPSAVSQQLAVLERETGAALLTRSPRGAVLTDAGRALAGRAGEVLALLDTARAELDRATGHLAGRVAVWTVASAAAGPVSAAVHALAGTDVRVQVVVAEPAAGIEALLAGDADLGVVDEYDYVPLALPDTCTTERLLDEPLVAVLPAVGPASRPAPGAGPGAGPDVGLDLAELAGADWVAPPEEAACGRAVRSACRAAGFEPAVRWETDDMWVLARAVAAGHGVTLLPRLAVADVPGVQLRPLARPLSRRLTVLTRTAVRERPAVAAVLAALRAATA